MGARRLAVAAAVLAAAPVLAGCEVAGSLDFGDESVGVDLTVSTEGDSCPRTPTSLRAQRISGDGEGSVGPTVCRITGNVRYEGIDEEQPTAWLNRLATRSDEHIYVMVPAGMAGRGSERLDAIDLELRFPGPVLVASPGSETRRNTVRFTDARAVRSTGITVAAGRQSQLPPLTQGLLTGLLGGLVGGGLAGWLVGRWRPATKADPVAPTARDETDAPHADPLAPLGPAPRRAPDGWASPSTSAAPTASGPHAGDDAEPPQDPGVWAPRP